MTALVTDGMPDWWTAEHAETAATMMSAALAEAGYPCDVTPDRRTGDADPSWPSNVVPLDVSCRARSLVYLRMGIDFEWCPTCPDGHIHRERHDRLHAAEARP